MKDVADRLAAIGFRRPRRAPDCWRVIRIDLPAPAAASRVKREPAQSRTLPRWLDRLADCRRPSPYRITPIRRRAPG